MHVVDQDAGRRLGFLDCGHTDWGQAAPNSEIPRKSLRNRPTAPSTREGAVVPFSGRPGRSASAKMRSGGTGGGASMKRQSDSFGTLISAPMRLPLSITV